MAAFYKEEKCFLGLKRTNSNKHGLKLIISRILLTNKAKKIIIDANESQLSFQSNHYYFRKVERCTVIIRKTHINIPHLGTDDVVNFELDDNKQPAYVDIPIRITHNITNIGEDTLNNVSCISVHYE